ncbi:hypothetical protein PHMEG_00026525 [Phytophthora megakarya]|uniref:RxLR effector protein n=1 Tax=Phytophthora megakarya TaxID=4795 RepID=A0A225V9F1_9STRA|nr:hypothetical protein PHMEG_00026525 [Phytophthora megakarya]
MRTTSVLFAVVAITNSIVTTDAASTSISTETSMDQTHSMSTVLGNTEGKRFLRRHKEPGDDDDDEERINATKLQNLRVGSTTSQFRKWKDKDYSEWRIYNKLKKYVESGDLTKGQLADISRWYREFK